LVEKKKNVKKVKDDHSKEKDKTKGNAQGEKEEEKGDEDVNEKRETKNSTSSSNEIVQVNVDGTVKHLEHDDFQDVTVKGTIDAHDADLKVDDVDSHADGTVKRVDLDEKVKDIDSHADASLDAKQEIHLEVSDADAKSKLKDEGKKIFLVNY